MKKKSTYVLLFFFLLATIGLVQIFLNESQYTIPLAIVIDVLVIVAYYLMEKRKKNINKLKHNQPFRVIQGGKK